MVFPVSGYIHKTNNPLVGYAFETAVGYPKWFNSSPTGVIHKLHTILGLELDKFNILSSNFLDGFIPGEGNLYEPRVAHIIPYLPGPYTHNGRKVDEAKTYIDFILSISPVYFEIPEGILFRNLDTQLGTSVPIGSIVEDKLYYYSNTLTETYRFNSLPEVESITGVIISPLTTAPAVVSYKDGLVTGNVVSLRNHWDTQALILGTYRRPNESNIDVYNKIQALNYFSMNNSVHLEQSICTQLSLAKVIEVTPGETITVSGNVFSTSFNNVWGKEILSPVQNNYWEGVILPKQTFKYLKTFGVSPIVENASLKTNKQIQAEYIYNVWNYSNNQLSVNSEHTDSLQFLNTRGIRVYSLLQKKSMLYTNGNLSEFGYSVLRELSSIFSTYGTGKWSSFTESSVIAETFPVLFQD